MWQSSTTCFWSWFLFGLQTEKKNNPLYEVVNQDSRVLIKPFPHWSHFDAFCVDKLTFSFKQTLSFSFPCHFQLLSPNFSFWSWPLEVPSLLWSYSSSPLHPTGSIRGDRGSWRTMKRLLAKREKTPQCGKAEWKSAADEVAGSDSHFLWIRASGAPSWGSFPTGHFTFSLHFYF